MAKSGPSRLRPLTLRFLTGLARAHFLGGFYEKSPGYRWGCA
ncbi:Hypothetical protein LOCK908_1840 [Lacticaseibacillus rhamnosus LOCK908]|nr:Hypothetical protein LOCK908_1840 [Lacticaseibacillus rhamnosus LOCK908]